MPLLTPEEAFDVFNDAFKYIKDDRDLFKLLKYKTISEMNQSPWLKMDARIDATLQNVRVVKVTSTIQAFPEMTENWENFWEFMYKEELVADANSFETKMATVPVRCELYMTRAGKFLLMVGDYEYPANFTKTFGFRWLTKDDIVALLAARPFHLGILLRGLIDLSHSVKYDAEERIHNAASAKRYVENIRTRLELAEYSA